MIVREQGYMYLGGPELTFAATREQVDAESSAARRCTRASAGVTDQVAEDDRHALAITREIVRDLRRRPRRAGSASRRCRRATTRARSRPDQPRPEVPTDTREVLARFVDDSRFQEFKPLYGDTPPTGSAHLHGHPVGILANQGVLFTESALKAAHFIDSRCERDIPPLFIERRHRLQLRQGPPSRAGSPRPARR